MMFIQPQTLLYETRAEDIEQLSHALDLLRQKDAAGASQVLVTMMTRLQEAQRPKVVEYNPRLEEARARARQ